MADRDLQPDPVDEFRDLALRYFDDALDHEGFDRFCELIESDPANAARFYELSMRCESMRTALVREARPTPAPTVSPGRSDRSNFAPVALLIAAALLVSAAVFAVYVFVINVEPELIDGPVVPIATLIDSTGTVVVDNDIALPGSEHGRGAYHLDSGSADLLLTSRVGVRMSGKTQMSVRGSMLASVQAGSVAFECPPGTEGFTVELPNGIRVVDLGTAFRLRVRESAIDLVVTEGSVRVEGAGEAPQVLVAGRSVRIDSTERAVIADASDGDPLPPIVGDYRDLMLSMNPTTYLPMDAGADPLVLANLADPDSPGSVHVAGDASPVVEGVSGDALYLRGPSFGDWAILPSYIKPTEQLTVVAWIKADGRPRHATIAKNWGGNDPINGIGQFHLDLWRDDGDLAAAVGQADGTHVLVREDTPTPLPLDRWHHVALVVTGTEAILYRDGRRIASTPCAGLRHPTPIEHVGIGVKPAANEPRPDSGYWRGALDELAIFDRALSDDQIRELYEAARPVPNESEDREPEASS